MFDQFQASRPVHPLAAFFTTLFTLAAGMICSRTPFLFVYIAVLAVLFLFYGFYMAVLMLTLGMGVFGVIAGGVTALINGTLDQFWITPARCLLVGVCVVPMLSTPPAQLARSLNQLKFPRLMTLGMLITVRFIPILYTEIWQIRDAMRSRGLDTRWYSPAWLRPSNLYRAFLVPLIMRAVSISDTLSLSVETRGFDPGRKDATIYRPVSFTARDAALIALTVLASMGLAWARFLL